MEDGWFQQKLSNGRKCGGGMFMTEWGAFPGLTKLDIDTANYMGGLADSQLQSWSWWQFKSFNDITTASTGSMESFYFQNGTLQVAKVKALSRTYAYAIAGNPSSMSFNPSTSEFSLIFALNLNAKGPTEVFYNSKWYYPQGISVTVTPNVLQWKKSAQNRLAFSPTRDAANGQVITISIKQ